MTVNPDRALKELGIIIDNLENAHIAINAARIHSSAYMDIADWRIELKITPASLIQLSDDIYSTLNAARELYKRSIENATSEE